MKSCCFLTLLLTCVGLCGRAAAADPWWRCWHRAPCPTCPNDYRPKPLPVTCPTRACGPNDYCPKPLPGACPVLHLGPNDYCPKPLPAVTRCYPPWYTCGPDCR